MKVWLRGAALAGAALFWAGTHVGAQIRESVNLPSGHAQGPGLAERPNHPVVLLNSHAGLFSGEKQIVAQLMLKQLDPAEAVEKVTPPKGIDGIIAYPGARMLMVRGTEEAVAGYRASLEKVDRQVGKVPSQPGRSQSEGEVAGGRPVVLIPAKGKLQLKADRLVQQGKSTEAIGHVVLDLANGIELRAERVRVTGEDGERRIEIEK